MPARHPLLVFAFLTALMTVPLQAQRGSGAGSSSKPSPSSSSPRSSPAPAPRASAPAPRAQAPAPRAQAPAPRVQAPAPSPRVTAPQPRVQPSTPRATPAQPRVSTPSPRPTPTRSYTPPPTTSRSSPAQDSTTPSSRTPRTYPQPGTTAPSQPTRGYTPSTRSTPKPSRDEPAASRYQPRPTNDRVQPTPERREGQVTERYSSRGGDLSTPRNLDRKPTPASPTRVADTAPRVTHRYVPRDATPAATSTRGTRQPVVTGAVGSKSTATRVQPPVVQHRTSTPLVLASTRQSHTRGGVWSNAVGGHVSSLRCGTSTWNGFWDPWRHHGHHHRSYWYGSSWQYGFTGGCGSIWWSFPTWPWWYYRSLFWNTGYRSCWWDNYTYHSSPYATFWWYPTTTYCPTYLYVPTSVVEPVVEEPAPTAAAPAPAAPAAGSTELLVAGSLVGRARSDSLPAGSSETLALAAKYIELGDFYFRADRFAAAAEAYGKARHYAPDDASVHFVLADAVFATGDYHYAAFLIGEALRLDPRLAAAEADKRTFYSSADVFESQLAALDHYLEERPYDAQAQLVRGYNLTFSGRRAAATLAFQRVLEIEAENRAAKTFLDALAATPAGAEATR